MVKKSLKSGVKFGVFDVVIYAVIGLLVVITLIPFINILAISMSAYDDKTLLFPKNFTLKAYEIMFSPRLYKSFFITVFIVIVSTVLHVVLCLLTAYPLSRKYLPYRRFFLVFILITMLFGGGMVPYFLIVRALGLVDNIFTFIIPGLASGYNILLMKNFLLQIPESLEEAARMDGAGYFRILFQIFLPLSMPIIATLALFFGVGKWNDWFTAILFIRENTQLYPIQNVLRMMVIDGNYGTIGGGIIIPDATLTSAIKMAVIVIATLPIVCVYPFLQKYFVKGIFMGSVKE